MLWYGGFVGGDGCVQIHQVGGHGQIGRISTVGSLSNFTRAIVSRWPGRSTRQVLLVLLGFALHLAYERSLVLHLT